MPLPWFYVRDLARGLKCGDLVEVLTLGKLDGATPDCYEVDRIERDGRLAVTLNGVEYLLPVSTLVRFIEPAVHCVVTEVAPTLRPHALAHPECAGGCNCPGCAASDAARKANRG